MAISAVVKTAFPELSSVAVPNTVFPSMKTTHPLAGPPPESVTVAVKVTGWPTIHGLSVAVSVVVVAVPIAVGASGPSNWPPSTVTGLTMLPPAATKSVPSSSVVSPV